MTKTHHTLALLCALVGAFALMTTPALAREVHVYTSSFASAGAGNGQFKEPAGVAVNDSTSLVEPGAGDVYVVDKGNNRVEYFSSTGEYMGQFNDAGALSKPEWIAVDNDPLSESHGDVYVTENAHKVIDKFSATGAYLGQITKGAGGAAFGELYGVAVDLTGGLWVYQSTKEVDNYSDALANVFLESREVNDTLYSASPGFAVGPEDDLYANLNVNGGAFAQFSSAGEFITFPERYTGFAAQTAAAVNLSSDELYLDYGTTIAAADPATEKKLDTFGSGHLSAGAGVAVNSSSNSVYVADSAADRVVVFGASEVADTITEPAAPVEKNGSPALDVGDSARRFGV